MGKILGSSPSTIHKKEEREKDRKGGMKRREKGRKAKEEKGGKKEGKREKKKGGKRKEGMVEGVPQ